MTAWLSARSIASRPGGTRAWGVIIMLSFPAASVRTLIAPIGGLIGRCNLRALRRQRVCEVSLVLTNLVQDLQLHRGLSGALLIGQVASRAELEAVEYKLQRRLQGLTDHYRERHPVFKGAQWRMVLGRWESLRHNWRDLSFQTNLAVHGEVVAGLLSVLRVLAAENAQLLGDSRSQVIRSWPALAEHLGVLRAWGMYLLAGAAGAHDTSPGESLGGRLQTARLALHTLAPTVDDPGLTALSEEALHCVASVRDGSWPGANAQLFHSELTLVIDAWFRSIRGRIQVVP